MKVYQENEKSINGSTEITNNEFLYEKARNGLMELSISLGIEVMRMMLEEDPLNKAIMARLLSGVSTRKYVRTVDGDI